MMSLIRFKQISSLLLCSPNLDCSVRVDKEWTRYSRLTLGMLVLKLRQSCLPIFACLLEKAPISRWSLLCGVYVVSMPGEVKDPTKTCGNYRRLDNS